MVKKILFIFAALLLVIAGIGIGLVLIDQKSNISLPSELRIKIRKVAGYCIDNRELYWKNSPPFTVGSNSCTVCSCNPQQGGVTCRRNQDISSCI